MKFYLKFNNARYKFNTTNINTPLYEQYFRLFQNSEVEVIVTTLTHGTSA